MTRAKLFVERVPRPEMFALFLDRAPFETSPAWCVRPVGCWTSDCWVDSRANLERASVYCGLAKLVDIYSGAGQRLRVETTALARRRLSLLDQRVSWMGEGDHATLVPASCRWSTS